MAESTVTHQQQLRRLLAEASDAYLEAIQTRDRSREVWARIAAQHQRLAAEWAAANQYFRDQTAALEQQAAELACREKQSAEMRAEIEAEVAGLREEAAVLERRIHAVRMTLSELESHRQQVLAEMAGHQPGTPLPQPIPSTRSQAIEIDPADHQRIVAEQLAVLREAETQWRRAEWQTVVEMEALAHQLCQREQELDARERRLIQAEARRRDELHKLWRLRLQLEAWQSQLTAETCVRPTTTAEPSRELLTLRDELERLAALLIELAPPDAELPLAVEDAEIGRRPLRVDSRAA
jgi:hypothetical protein